MTEVLANGGNFYQYMENESKDEMNEIKNWLKHLPKPLALFCCDDAHALLITEICKVEGISIPSEVSVLGVDDDELLCDISDPTISSIRMDVENGGYLTCQLLNERIHKRDTRTFNVSIKPLSISERGSTRMHNIDDKHVAKLVDYIQEHYFEDLSMDYLLSLVPFRDVA